MPVKPADKPAANTSDKGTTGSATNVEKPAGEQSGSTSTTTVDKPATNPEGSTNSASGSSTGESTDEPTADTHEKGETGNGAEAPTDTIKYQTPNGTVIKTVPVSGTHDTDPAKNVPDGYKIVKDNGNVVTVVPDIKKVVPNNNMSKSMTEIADKHLINTYVVNGHVVDNNGHEVAHTAIKGDEVTYGSLPVAHTESADEVSQAVLNLGHGKVASLPASKAEAVLPKTGETNNNHGGAAVGLLALVASMFGFGYERKH